MRYEREYSVDKSIKDRLAKDSSHKKLTGGLCRGCQTL